MKTIVKYSKDGQVPISWICLNKSPKIYFNSKVKVSAYKEKNLDHRTFDFDQEKLNIKRKIEKPS